MSRTGIILWNLYAYGFATAMLSSLGRDFSIGASIFLGLFSWGTVIARYLS